MRRLFDQLAQLVLKLELFILKLIIILKLFILKLVIGLIELKLFNVNSLYPSGRVCGDG